MINLESIDYNTYLPPYRSLLNPNARYDYKTHSLIPISQNELNVLNTNLRERNNHNLSFKNLNTKAANGGFKMKYKSLLGDVGRSLSLRLSSSNLMGSSTSILTQAKSQKQSSQKLNQSQATNQSISQSQSQSQSQVQSQIQPQTQSQSQSINSLIFKPHTPLHLRNLPIEIIDFIFYLVDNKQDYKSCIYTCKLFYFFAKPYYYEALEFNSTYRFAQFVSYLRLNSEVGHYVKYIDLSGIKPGYDKELEDDIEAMNNLVLNHNQLHQDQHHHAIPHQGHQGLMSDFNHVDDSFNDATSKKVMAGWRDWKFKSNPLYSIHPSSSISLTKIASNSQILSSSAKSTTSSYKYNSKRFAKPFKYFKSKKRRHSMGHVAMNRRAPIPEHINISDGNSATLLRNTVPHPHMNKFLLNYSTSKDIPAGYVLHLINLCPNITSLNLGNLSLSIDYEISRAMIYKYQTFDLMNNYPKDIIYKIDDAMRLDEFGDDLSFQGSLFNSPIMGSGGSIVTGPAATSNASVRQLHQHPSNKTLFGSIHSSSSASLVYSLATFSKPIRKYNSLLPPLPQTVNDISYLNKGDGKVYLSDLNLKSINNSYLNKINEEDLLSVLIRMHGTKNFRNLTYVQTAMTIRSLNNTLVAGNLKYINLSSTIWLNKSLVQKFLSNLIVRNFHQEDSSEYFSDTEDIVDVDSTFDSEFGTLIDFKQDLVIDLSNSGMYKNLPWARKIDLNTEEGCKLAYKIITNVLQDPFDEYMNRERLRRGRIGENYLS